MSKVCLTGHHPHTTDSDLNERSKAMSRLKIAFFLGLGFIGVEILGAWLSGSLALFADAIHMMADSFALGFALLAGLLAQKPISERRSFGYYRLEVLAALTNGLLLIGMAVFISLEALDRWSNPQEVHALPMLITACVGLVVNLVMLWIIHPTHQHGMNLRGAFLHVLGDTISSVAVILGAVVLWVTHQVWPDLAASLVVAALILVMAGKLTWDAIHVLLEGTPRHIQPSNIIEEILREFPEVKEIHDFHVWEITSHLSALTAHLEVNLQSVEESSHLIARINELLEKRHKIAHTTFQIEPWAMDSSNPN